MKMRGLIFFDGKHDMGAGKSPDFKSFSDASLMFVASNSALRKQQSLSLLNSLESMVIYPIKLGYISNSDDSFPPTSREDLFYQNLSFDIYRISTASYRLSTDMIG